MDQIDAWLTWGAVEVAKFGLFAFLAGDNDNADDETFADCHDFVLDALSDADKARTIETITGKNLRESLTVEEIQALHEERELRRMKDRN